MENILIIDLETTGLSVAKGCKVIEIGAILYNITHKEMTQCISTLMPCQENPVEDINGIKASLTNCNYFLSPFIDSLEAMASSSDAIIAHNAQFDHDFLKSITFINNEFWKKPWICTKRNFKWPSNPPRLRLMDVCESLDIPYVNAHRSLADCRLLAACLSKVDDLRERLERCINNI